jgi:hypothetical protein
MVPPIVSLVLGTASVVATMLPGLPLWIVVLHLIASFLNLGRVAYVLVVNES